MKKLLLLSALLIFSCSYGQKIKLSKLDTTKFKVVQYKHITPIEFQSSEIKLDTILNNNKK